MRIDPKDPKTWPDEYSYAWVVINNVLEKCEFVIIKTPVFGKKSTHEMRWYRAGRIGWLRSEGTTYYPCDRNGWIRVEDGGPSDGALVRAANMDVEPPIQFDAVYTNDLDRWDKITGCKCDADRSSAEVTHWMPGTPNPEVPATRKAKGE